MVGIFIVEMRYKISKQPYLTSIQQAPVMVGRLIVGLAIMSLVKLMWLNALQTTFPSLPMWLLLLLTRPCLLLRRLAGRLLKCDAASVMLLRSCNEQLAGLHRVLCCR